MPLVIITGHPSSGKTTIVRRLEESFKKHGKDVFVVIDEQFGSFDRSCYDNAAKEKELRSWLRSEVQQNLTKNKIVICDSLNYIKGYRYELFLLAKMCKTTYCVVQCTPNKATCEWLNSQKAESARYTDDQISQLLMRYERPVPSKFRWEKPLFEVQIGKMEKPLKLTDDDDMSVDLDHPSPLYAEIHEDHIIEWICNGVELTENQSTQVVPLAPANFLHELDRTTQDVITYYMNAQRTAVRGQNIVIPKARADSNEIKFMKISSLPELNRLRHQFVNMAKRDPITDKEQIATLFVDFLKNNMR